MTIAYNGVEFCLEDPRGELAAYVAKYFEWPRATVGTKPRTIDSKIRVQRPAWPDAPCLRPNQLYWPTGATRWAQFIGIASDAAMFEILGAMDSTGKATLEIELNDSLPVTVFIDNTTDGPSFNLQEKISATMYLLAPQPVTIQGNTAWLVPLVDERYWWQTRMMTTTAATWGDLITEIKASLGGATIDNDSELPLGLSSGIPDPCIFSVGAINTAAALDMVAWSIGKRLVNKYVGSSTYLLRSLATAKDLYEAERDAQLSSSVSGGSSAGDDANPYYGDVPKNIVFHFTNDSEVDLFDVTNSDAPDFAFGKTLDLMCPAVWTGSGANESSLTDLADKWAVNWWDWCEKRFAWGFNRVLRWHFTGYEDHALIDLSRVEQASEEDLEDDGEIHINPYVARTFVRSLGPQYAWDFVPMQLQGQQNDCGGTCDCCECCATLWYVKNDEILWSADHFAGVSEETFANFGTNSQATWANSADVDDDGNVYQGGPASAWHESDLSRPQAAMYTLRSYTSTGVLRWSWSSHPYGYSAAGLRAKPYAIEKVRCGGNSIFAQDLNIYTVAGQFYRFNQSGSIVWTLQQADLSDLFNTHPGPHGCGAFTADEGTNWNLIAAGPTRVLYASNTDGLLRLILDHDGNAVWAECYALGSSEFGAWMDEEDNSWFIANKSAVGQYDPNGNLDPGIGRDFSPSTPAHARASADVWAGNIGGSSLRTYETATGMALLNSVSSSELPLMVGTNRIGTRTDEYARLRNLDLSANKVFQGLRPSSAFNITDAMPFGADSVWSGNRRCGVTLVDEGTTETTTTSTSTTSTTTGSSSTSTTTTESSSSTSTTSTTTTTDSSSSSSSTTTTTTTESSSSSSSTTTTDTSSSTSSTSSTTTGGCVSMGCTWLWDGANWVNTDNECVVPCAACVTPPEFSGSYNGQTATTDCEISI